MTPLQWEDVVTEQRNTFMASGDEYPFLNQFHPGVVQPAVGIDLNMIQEDFDAYDLAEAFNNGDFVNWEGCWEQ